MNKKLLPETWIAGFIASATNGRRPTARLRRIMTLIVIPIWVIALIWASTYFYSGCVAVRNYFEILLKGMPIDEYDISYAKMGMLNLWVLPACFLFLFVIPWVVIRLVFWVIDAKDE